MGRKMVHQFTVLVVKLEGKEQDFHLLTVANREKGICRTYSGERGGEKIGRFLG